MPVIITVSVLIISNKKTKNEYLIYNIQRISSREKDQNMKTLTYNKQYDLTIATQTK